ncbi:hypothetical protein ACP6H1_27480 [Vibrio harveyi]|uniref:hypothetical protein n=1 Tax=Vibrio harveyi TaxID=669 RepID=UPI003CF5E20A
MSEKTLPGVVAVEVGEGHRLNGREGVGFSREIGIYSPLHGDKYAANVPYINYGDTENHQPLDGNGVDLFLGMFTCLLDQDRTKWFMSFIGSDREDGARFESIELSGFKATATMPDGTVMEMFSDSSISFFSNGGGLYAEWTAFVGTWENQPAQNPASIKKWDDIEANAVAADDVNPELLEMIKAIQA